MDNVMDENDDGIQTGESWEDNCDETLGGSLGREDLQCNGHTDSERLHPHNRSRLRKRSPNNSSCKHDNPKVRELAETRSCVNKAADCCTNNKVIDKENSEDTRDSCEIKKYSSIDPVLESEQVNSDVIKTNIEVDNETLERVKLDLLYGNEGHNDPHMHNKVSSLKLDDLPAALRFESVLQFLHLCSLLAVKISVEHSSRRKRSGKKLQTPFSGTGWLFDKPAEIDVKAGSQNSQGIIYIATSGDLILNNSEARSCVVEFSASAPQYFRERALRGSSVENICISGQTKTFLKCVTQDTDLAFKLNMLQEEIRKLSSSLPLTIKERLTRIAIVIGYSQGSKPALSFSDSTVIRRKLVEGVFEGKRQISLKNIVTCPSDHVYDTVQVLLHTAITWPGCLGAPVITFQKKCKDNGQLNYTLDIWTHLGKLKLSDFGCTNVKEEELNKVSLHLLAPVEPQQISQITQQHTSQTSQQSVNGKTLPADPSLHQEINQTLLHSISETSQQTDPQQVMNSTPEEPILTEPMELPACQTSASVAPPGLEPPSYPVYSTEKKRLGSFHQWPKGNIHKPADLAWHGFFYAGYSDCVRCHQCGLGLRSWKEGDDILTEHQRFRPGCPFLRRLLLTRSETRDSPLTPQGQSNSRKPSTPSLTVQSHSGIANQLDATSGLEATNQEAVVSPSGGVQAGSEVSAIVLPVLVSYTNPDRFVLEMSHESEKKNLCVGIKDDGGNPAIFNPILNPEESALGHVQDVTTRLLQTENRKLQDLLTCKMCHQNPIKALFLPCGDLYACESCCNDLSHCPHCKKRILGTVTTFFA